MAEPHDSDSAGAGTGSRADEIPPPPAPVRRGRVRAVDRQTARMLVAVRLLYMVLLVTISLLPFVGSITDQSAVSPAHYGWAFIVTFGFGIGVLVLDAATPDKRLASVFGIYLGVVAGLLGALAIGALLDLLFDTWSLDGPPFNAYKLLLKLAIGITLCYVAVSIVLTTKDDFRLVIPYVEFAKQVRGVRPLLMDSSALIDGRIDALARTSFVDAPIVVPQFVLDELQALADSSDRIRRQRGRRGLDLVTSLQGNPYVSLTIDRSGNPGEPVDRQLLQLASDQKLRILTGDVNLVKVARIQGVPVLNLHELASSLRPQILTGDDVEVEIQKRGEGAGQGVGYLPDGTMVVVEGAADRIGQGLTAIVTNILQTAAGRMIFARPKVLTPSEQGAEGSTPRQAGTAPGAEHGVIHGAGVGADEGAGGSHPGAHESAERMAQRATSQPRTPPRSTAGESRGGADDPPQGWRRNPRR